MAKGQGKRIPDEVRAQIIAALLVGQGVSEIARQYKIDASTVSRLKKVIPSEKLQQVAIQKRDELSDLIGEFLTEGFKAVKNIWNITENNDWLSQQPAHELATFVGVTSDKLFRVLEAIENAQPAKAEDS
jgi:transposase-like protein